jgi:hypothetical protein
MLVSLEEKQENYAALGHKRSKQKMMEMRFVYAQA